MGILYLFVSNRMSLFNLVLMSQVYTSILRSVTANTFLLGSFDLSEFQNLHCGEKSSMLYLFIYLFIYLIDFI